MLKPLHVLVVDDHPGMCTLVASYLAEHGMRVTTRLDAAAGLQVVREDETALAITDGKMAGMNGLEFIRAARRLRPQMAIILMTAFEEEFSLQDALHAGADGYITKPFTMDKLGLLLQKAYWTAIAREDWWDVYLEDEADVAD